MATNDNATESSNDTLQNTVDFDKTAAVGSTNWLRLETITYHDASGTPRVWDRAVRTTKQSETAVDAVAILAVLQSGTDRTQDKIFLVKQFRPPVNAFTVELPAGLVDKGESPSEAAVREFREETGYVGEVMSVSPTMFLSPGLSNESVSVVRLKVDMTKACNQNPSPLAEESEIGRGLETMLVPRLGLQQTLTKMSDEEGIKIFGMLYSFAIALELEI